MVHYDPVKITIDASGLAEITLDVVVQHHGLLDSILSDRSSLFIFKFWVIVLLVPWQNSSMEAYLWAFANFEQNDWARLLPIAELAYNNAKNASFGHTPFELNYGYHPRMS